MRKRRRRQLENSETNKLKTLRIFVSWSAFNLWNSNSTSENVILKLTCFPYFQKEGSRILWSRWTLMSFTWKVGVSLERGKNSGLDCSTYSISMRRSTWSKLFSLVRILELIFALVLRLILSWNSWTVSNNGLIIINFFQAPSHNSNAQSGTKRTTIAVVLWELRQNVIELSTTLLWTLLSKR